MPHAPSHRKNPHPHLIRDAQRAARIGLQGQVQPQDIPRILSIPAFESIRPCFLTAKMSVWMEWH